MNDFEARQLTLPEFFLHFFANLFQNPFAALANGSIPAVVVFAMFIGIAPWPGRPLPQYPRCAAGISS